MAQKKLITWEGETKTLTEWAEDGRCTVLPNTLSCRINRGWDVGSAITEPVKKNGADFDYAKLSEKDVVEIFRLREEELWSFKELSEEFGVTSADIGYVLHGTVWGWVDHKYEYSGGRVWKNKDGTRYKIPHKGVKT